MEEQQTERGAAFQVCAQSHVTPRSFGRDVHLPGQAESFAPLSQWGHGSHRCHV